MSVSDNEEGGGLFCLASGEMLRLRSSAPKIVAGLCLFTFCSSSLGCLHPNLPSVRHERRTPPGVDFFSIATPEVLGQETGISASTVMPVRSPMGTQVRAPGGPIDCPPDDPSHVRTGALAQFLCDQDEMKEPDVPWPRFHPLPTTPVYGP